jgi:AcrR family transcriptional regulator
MTYDETGRVNQKRRTKAALVAAAREIVAAGHTPTIEEVAAAADVSRTTAYRYFTSQRSLLAAAHPETGRTSLLPPTISNDPVERLDAVLRSMIKTTIANESQQRTMLRLSLEGTAEDRAQLPLRQGRAIGWIAEALAPLRDRMAEREVRELALAIRATTGIESLVWLTDIAGLSSHRAGQLMRRSGLALLREAMRKA